MYSLNWSYAYGVPQSQACIKTTPHDFQVHELLSEPFSGEGEHIVLHIEKKGLNTEDVARGIARLINKPAKLISYAGLKDKQALTTQWFSIHAPGEIIAGVEQLSGPGWHVIASNRHNRKLKTGFLTGNEFIIQLRGITDYADIEHRLTQIKASGVPNYFGEQRFGREGANLLRAHEVLVEGRKVKDKFLKGMYYSAARSWLFNLLLSHRVQHGTWNRVLAGDVMQLSGSHSIFVADEADAILSQRIVAKDVSPASPLPGLSKNKVKEEAQLLMNELYAPWQAWLAGLEQQGLEEAWRANIVHPQHLQWQRNEDGIQLRFSLPPGCYATAILRELVSYVGGIPSY